MSDSDSVEDVMHSISHDASANAYFQLANPIQGVQGSQSNQQPTQACLKIENFPTEREFCQNSSHIKLFPRSDQKKDKLAKETEI